MMSVGWWSIYRFRGGAIRLHFSIPLAAFVFGRFAFVPGFWLGFVTIVLFHELGHAAMVRLVGARVSNIDVHGLGGSCSWYGNPTPLGRAWIAWGGVLAQAVVLAFAWTWILVRPPHSVFAAQLLSAYTYSNLWLMAINLLPIPPLDGAEAWALPGLLRKWWQLRRAKQTLAKVKVASARERAEQAWHFREPSKAKLHDKELDARADDLLERAKKRLARRSEDEPKN